MLAAGSVGRLPFSVRSPWKVGIGVLGIPSPGFWSGRITVVHLILTFRVQICKTLIRVENGIVFYALVPWYRGWYRDIDGGLEIYIIK